MRLLLIRHGQTPANVAGTLETAHPGPGLTELGLDQAAAVPGALEGTPIESIWVSTLVRTRLTAEPLALARGLAIGELPGIHEISAGSLEGRRDREAVLAYLETVFAWGSGALDARMPGGDDGHEFFGRFDDSIATVHSSRDGTAAVFCHGAAIRVWVAGRAANVPPSFAAEHDIRNTGIVELDGDPHNGWRLLTWQGTAVGGHDLDDPSAGDPTGDTLAEARED